MSRLVVITRPLAQARPFAEKVAALGRKPVIFPLLEIHALQDNSALQDALADVSQYALVAFVSPNAIDAAFAVRPEWPDNVGFAVVGEGSRAALARHGVSGDNANIVSPLNKDRTDSQTLLEALDRNALRDKQVLIVRGETGRELLADELRAAGARVRQVAAYRRSVPILDNARRTSLMQLMSGQHDWVITSSEALRNLVQMVEEMAGEHGVAEMRQQRLIVPHVRIAETAQKLGFTVITLTGSGDEHLLAALQSHS